MYSVGDIFEKFYGKHGRKIIGVCCVITGAGMLGAQVSAMGYVFKLFFGVSQFVGIIVGCSIVISYSVCGGIKSGIATDILQFSLLIILIPLTVFIGIYSLGDVGLLYDVVANDLSSESMELTPIITIVGLFLSLLVGETMIPHGVQRLLITKNVRQTIQGTIYSALVSIPFFAIVGVAGIVVRLLEPELDANLALPYLISVVMPIGLKGLAIASIIGVIMSSADAYLNAASVSVVQDLVAPSTKTKLSDKSELYIAKISTFLMGALAIVFALSMDSVLDILLYSYNFWSPIILVPLVGGIFGYIISLRAFIISGILSFTLVVVWQAYFAKIVGFDGLILGVLINLICFICAYTYNKFISKVEVVNI